jgi:hypothetical protein
MHATEEKKPDGKKRRKQAKKQRELRLALESRFV